MSAPKDRWLKIVDHASAEYVLRLYEALNYTQSWKTFGGESIIRMEDGRGIKQYRWSKLRAEVSGSGLVPAGLMQLDYRQPVTFYSGVPRQYTGSLASGTYRTDGEYAPRTISVNQVNMSFYYPIFTGIVPLAPDGSFEWGQGANSSTWGFAIEEV